MSAQIFDRYLDALDADRLFLLQSDVDRFAPLRDKLGEAIYNEDLSAPFAIYNLYIQRVNERLAGFEQIKRFTLVPTEFTQDGGELTPTLKIKRRFVEQKYRAIIDAMYAGLPKVAAGSAAAVASGKR